MKRRVINSERPSPYPFVLADNNGIMLQSFHQTMRPTATDQLDMALRFKTATAANQFALATGAPFSALRAF